MELEKRGRRDKSLLIQRLWEWFSIMPAWTYRKLLDNHVLDDVKYHSQFFSLLHHTCISKYIRLQNSSYPRITMYRHSTTWGSSSHPTLHINYTARKHTHDKPNKCWYSPAAYSMPYIVKPHYHTFNKGFTEHLLERCAGHEMLWNTRAP